MKNYRGPGAKKRAENEERGWSVRARGASKAANEQACRPRRRPASEKTAAQNLSRERRGRGKRRPGYPGVNFAVVQP